MQTPKQVSETAKAYFRSSGYYCAESVLLALSEAKAIQSEIVPSIASGFCSGASRTGGMCGALSGAIMGLSLHFGRQNAEQSIEPAYAAVQEFLALFSQENGSTSCTTLIGLDLNTGVGQELYQKQQKHAECQGFVGRAAELAMELIENPPLRKTPIE